MAKRFPTRNIWKLMLDIRPAKTMNIFGYYGRKIAVDFFEDRYYKGAELPILVSRVEISSEEKIRRNFYKEFENLENKLTLLSFKNRGVRFVVEVPKIELD